MDPSRFDRLACRFGRAPSRRRVLGVLLAGLLTPGATATASEAGILAQAAPPG